MPKEQRPLSKAEMEVARTLWDLGEATVREVHEMLAQERDIDIKTVQTYLRRLEAKGYLRTRTRGKSKVYRPRVPRRQVIRQTVDDFVSRLFGGAALPLFQHLIHDRGLSDDEVRKLREMLRELEDKK